MAIVLISIIGSILVIEDISGIGSIVIEYISVIGDILVIRSISVIVRYTSD